ncbi:septum formation initiator family protein [Gemmatimonadota bacterium]
MAGGGFRDGFLRFRRPRMPEKLPARRVVMIVVGGVLFYLLVLSEFGFLQRWELSRERKTIEAQIRDARERKIELESQRGELGDDAALERIAREEHGMVRAGEHVYRLALPDSGEARERKR